MEGRIDPEETGAEQHLGLRHLIPDHQLPYRGDAQAQAGGLYNTVHGGGRQGDIRDEALRK